MTSGLFRRGTRKAQDSQEQPALSAPEPAPRVEIVSHEDLSTDIPSKDLMEETEFSFGGASGKVKSLPGGMLNRAAALGAVVVVAVIAGLAAAEVCSKGHMSGTVVTYVGLGTMFGVFILGLVWITRRRRNPAPNGGGARRRT